MGFYHAMCVSDARLDGKTAVVTGSNCGIGKCTVQDFYKRGARVIMACRTISKAKEAELDIKKACENMERLGEIKIVELDLTSLKSVRNCAKQLLAEEKEINLLVNNAGIMFSPEGKTEDGFEMQFGTNHLGHFLFTLLLLPKIIKSTPARIITVSSIAHCWGSLNIENLNSEKGRYNEKHAYYQSKIANILFAKELAKRLKDSNIDGVTTYSLHPGIINTDLVKNFDKAYFKGTRWLFQNVGGLIFKTPEQGAQTTIYCAVDEKAGKETGLYYAECKVKCSSLKASNMEHAKLLWEISWKMVGLPEDYDPFNPEGTSK